MHSGVSCSVNGTEGDERYRICGELIIKISIVGVRK